MHPDVDALVCDANILIDFCDEDEELIAVICKYVVALHVPIPVLAEVDQLNIESAAGMGLVIEETPLAYLDANHTLPGCSKQDSACFYMAKDNGWGCATNEKTLRKHCDKAGIPVVRGLRLILNAVEKGAITKKRAEKVAKGIVAANGWIKKDVLQLFLKELTKF